MVCDVHKMVRERYFFSCLNPYSIGIWSATAIVKAAAVPNPFGLNPYSIGIWSATVVKELSEQLVGSLNPYSIGIWSATMIDKDSCPSWLKS